MNGECHCLGVGGSRDQKSQLHGFEAFDYNPLVFAVYQGYLSMEILGALNFINLSTPIVVIIRIATRRVPSTFHPIGYHDVSPSQLFFISPRAATRF